MNVLDSEQTPVPVASEERINVQNIPPKSIGQRELDETVLTETSTNTLTNKTIDESTNTLTGVVTLTGTQTVSNKILTAPKIVSGGFIADANGNEQTIYTTTASAVNEITQTNAATGGAPIIEATGGDTNIHLVTRAKGNGLTKKSVLRQDITTNSYKHNTVTLSGWGYLDVSSVQEANARVTFGITFAAIPVVVVGALSLHSSAPTSLGDFSQGPDNEDKTWTFASRNQTTTYFDVGLRASGAFAASRYIGYSWIAVGEL